MREGWRGKEVAQAEGEICFFFAAASDVIVTQDHIPCYIRCYTCASGLT